MSRPTERETRFADWLAGMVTDRAAMATLRRGLGKPPGTVFEMDRYILKFLSEEGATEDYEPYYLVAALFALWHQGKNEVAPDPPPNLGASLRALVEKEAGKSSLEETERRVERRLVALLNCHRDDLPEHLRHTVSLLRSKDIPTNWAQLLHDIRGWDWESRSVQRAWSQAFWIAPARVKQKTEQTVRKEENDDH